MAWTRGDHNGIVYDGDQDWGDVDKTRIPWVGHANWHDLHKDKKTSWSWPHHMVVGGSRELDDRGVYKDGTLRLHPGGVTAFMSYAAQSRTEVDPRSVEHGRAHVVDDLGRDPEQYGALNTLLQAASGDIALSAAELEDVVGKVADLFGADAVPAGAAGDCLHAATLDGQAPEWVQVAETGRWLGHPKGPEVVETKHLQSALDAFRRHHAAHDNPLAIDYHHQSVVAKLKSGPAAPAAGWIHEMELRNDGQELWARVEWTGDAEHAIADKKYKYLSPVFRWNAPDPVTGEDVPLRITSVGLTNTPFITSMEALHEQYESAGATDGAGFSAREGTGPDREDDMDLIELLAKVAGKEPAEVAHALGLEAGADAEDEDVAQAVLHEAQADPETETVEVLPDELVHELGLEDGSGVEHAVKAVRKLQLDTVGSAVRAKLDLEEDADEEDVLHAIDELQEERREQDAQALVEHAVQEGRLPPSKKDAMMRIAKRDPEGARDLLHDLPQTVGPAEEREADSEHSEPLTPEQKAICSQLGIDEEEFAQY